MRQEALDSIAQTEKVLRKMHKQMENMSIKEIDRVATEKRIFTNEGKRVQKVTQAAAKSALNGDRMQASKGVRMVPYKSVQGFNVNILARKNGSVLIDSRKYEGADLIRNRYRSERSKLLASYWGKSRSFALRIAQHGTQVRTAGTKYSSKGGRGNRGVIKATDFMSTARSEIQKSADNIVRQLSFMEQLFMKE